MNEEEKRIAKELFNIYKFKVIVKKDPEPTNPIYKKYAVLKRLVDDLSRSHFAESNVLKLRYFEAKQWKQIELELENHRATLNRIHRKAIKLLTLIAQSEKENKNN